MLCRILSRKVIYLDCFLHWPFVARGVLFFCIFENKGHIWRQYEEAYLPESFVNNYYRLNNSVGCSRLITDCFLYTIRVSDACRSDELNSEDRCFVWCCVCEIFFFLENNA